jgi:hypothetical protein
MDRAIGAELLERLPDVDPAFLEENRQALLEAVVESPGVDSVRAAVLRHLDALAPADRAMVLQGAAEALRTYPDAVASGDPVQLMARHPAWVGLAHLELVRRLDGDPEAAREVAVQHARLGFSAAAKGPVQDGETLWAMAETAEEVGWEDHVPVLLACALEAAFADDDARAQVALLLATRRATDDPASVPALVADVVDGEHPTPLRVQAAFVLSRAAEASDAFGEALAWLDRAIALAVEADHGEVVAQLRAERARLGEA